MHHEIRSHHLVGPYWVPSQRFGGIANEHSPDVAYVVH